jgi:hypothetical protein
LEIRSQGFSKALRHLDHRHLAQHVAIPTNATKNLFAILTAAAVPGAFPSNRPLRLKQEANGAKSDRRLKSGTLTAALGGEQLRS